MMNKPLTMLEKCQTADERYALVFLMADDGSVYKRYMGNDHNGFQALDFAFNGEKYTYQPFSGADGTGGWKCIKRDPCHDGCKCYRH